MVDEKTEGKGPRSANILQFPGGQFHQAYEALYLALAMSVPLLLESLGQARRDSSPDSQRRQEELLEALSAAQSALAQAKRALRGVEPEL